MTSVEAIEALIKRKQEIDVLPTGRFVETHHWLIEAVELLLRLKLLEENQLKR
jgi:hypothetical protein